LSVAGRLALRLIKMKTTAATSANYRSRTCCHGRRLGARSCPAATASDERASRKAVLSRKGRRVDRRAANVECMITHCASVGSHANTAAACLSTRSIVVNHIRHVAMGVWRRPTNLFSPHTKIWPTWHVW